MRQAVIFLTTDHYRGGTLDEENISDILKRNSVVEEAMADVMALEQGRSCSKDTSVFDPLV